MFVLKVMKITFTYRILEENLKDIKMKKIISQLFASAIFVESIYNICLDGFKDLTNWEEVCNNLKDQGGVFEW